MSSGQSSISQDDHFSAEDGPKESEEEGVNLDKYEGSSLSDQSITYKSEEDDSVEADNSQPSSSEDSFDPEAVDVNPR